MFLSFYITDLKNALVFQHLLSYDSPTFMSLWTKLQAMAPESPNDDSWFKVNIGRSLQVYRFKSKANKLIYWCLATHQSNPLEPAVFLEGFDNTLLQYFDKDQLTISKMVNNQDRIALLLNCMVDANEPAVTDFNHLCDMVPSREDLSKVINSTASSLSNRISQRNTSQVFNIGDPAKGPATKEKLVPWRSAGVKYSNNELYVDVVETVHVILRKNEKTGELASVRGVLDGVVDFRSHLSGNPVIALNLRLRGHDLGMPALHQCCLDSYQGRPDQLRFVPPDGKFQLMHYSIDLDSLQSKSKLFSNIGLVSPDYRTELGDLGDEFEVNLNIAGSQHAKVVDDLVITLSFGPLPSECKIKVLRSTHGHFENCASNNIGKWVFDKETPTGTLPVLRGCLENATREQVRALQLSVSYTNRGELPSGIKVDSVDILSGLSKNIKPFKGVKYIAKTGDFHLR